MVTPSFGVESGSTLLENATVSGNSSGQYGTVISNFDGETSLINVTIFQNPSHALEVIHGELHILNSILAENYSNCSGENPIDSQGHNLEDDDDCEFSFNGDLSNTDPLFLINNFYFFIIYFSN